MLLLVCCVIMNAAASQTAASPALFICLVQKSSLEDWQRPNVPNFGRLLASGQIAVMNTRVARGVRDDVTPNVDAEILTFASGARAWAPPSPIYINRAPDASALPSVTQGQLWQRRTAMSPSQPEVCVDWAKILAGNSGLDHGVSPCSLGDQLQQHGERVRTSNDHYAKLLVTLSNGECAAMPFSEEGPFDVSVIDLGSDMLHADAALGRVLMQAQWAHGYVLVVSTSVGAHEYSKGVRLTPVGVWGPTLRPGLLTSPTTHRRGLIANVDISPSILGLLGLPAVADTPGHAVAFTYNSHAIEMLNSSVERDILQRSAQLTLPILAVVTGLAMICIAFILPRHRSPAASAILMTLWLSVLLATSGFGLIATLFACLFLAACIWRTSPAVVVSLEYVTILLFILAACLVVDFGRWSVLGPSAVEGARYYGIGNEMMGLGFGAWCALRGLMGTHGKTRHVVLDSVTLLIVTFVMAAPGLGSKFGALFVGISMLIALVYPSVHDARGYSKIFALAALIAVMLVSALASRHLHHMSTHFGEAFSDAKASHGKSLLALVLRKGIVDLHLMWRSTWAVSLWCGLSAFVAYIKTARRPSIHASQNWSVEIVGFSTCLFLNDAGAVAASLFLVAVFTANVVQTQTALPRAKINIA